MPEASIIILYFSINKLYNIELNIVCIGKGDYNYVDKKRIKSERQSGL